MVMVVDVVVILLRLMVVVVGLAVDVVVLTTAVVALARIRDRGEVRGLHHSKVDMARELRTSLAEHTATTVGQKTK